jgi:hypothetical protein
VYLINPLIYLGILAAGCIALAVVICKSRHWRYVLSDALLNTALLVGSALLVSHGSRFAVLLLVLVPSVLATVIAISSRAHSQRLLNLDAPPKYIRLYPTKPRTLVLMSLLMLIAIQQLVEWRERTDIQTAKLLDVAAIEAVASRSPNASSYLAAFKSKNGAQLNGKDLIEACGTVIRLAERDAVQVMLPHPTGSICRSAASYGSISSRQQH